MIGIGHFAIGVAGGFAILFYYPQLIPNMIKNDIFFVMLSGIWAMIPDIGVLWNNFTMDNAFIMNIFWGHAYIDTVTKDDPKTAAIFIAIAFVLGYLYFKKIGG